MNMLPQLNEIQQQAVTQTQGPVLILAGAGSGKTRVLTFRTVYMMTENHIPGYNILMVTFTNKAAGEMKSRVKSLLQEIAPFHNYSLPFMGTFHSLCVRILRIDGHHIGLSQNFTIYDTDDQKGLVNKILKSMDINTKKVSPSAIHGIISQCKNEMIGPDEYAHTARGPYQETVARVYAQYETEMKNNEAVDFDDLLNDTVELFKANQQVLEKYQNTFKYIMVDEYQDTNRVQYTLTNLLSKSHRNICVVGDMSQSIYKFRGADIRNIIAFEKDHQDAKVFHLEENYRSTQTILDAANFIIKKNKGHKVLNLFTNKYGGNKITLYEAQSEVDESHFIARKILENDYLYKDVAILYRTNAQSRALEETFIRQGIPYKLIGGIRFYERKEIKDLLAYLRLLANPSDNASLERVEKIGKTKLKLFTNWAQKLKERLQSAPPQIETQSEPETTEPINQEPTLFDMSQLNVVEVPINNDQITYAIDITNTPLTYAPSPLPSTLELLETILEVVDYIDYIDDGTEQGTARIENIKELKTVAGQYSNLNEFLEQITLVEDPETAKALKYDKTSDYNAVTMMTLHAAKGLEFKHVFIIGWEEGLFPHSRALLNPDELEEERRLAYVGITRAMEDLYLTYAASRTIYGQRNTTVTSRFLAEIPEDLLTLERSEEAFRTYLPPNKYKPQEDWYW